MKSRLIALTLTIAALLAMTACAKEIEGNIAESVKDSILSDVREEAGGESIVADGTDMLFEMFGINTDISSSPLPEEVTKSEMQQYIDKVKHKYDKLPWEVFNTENSDRKYRDGKYYVEGSIAEIYILEENSNIERADLVLWREETDTWEFIALLEEDLSVKLADVYETFSYARFYFTYIGVLDEYDRPLGRFEFYEIIEI